MNAYEVWSIAGAIIVSVGGAGTIVCATASFLASRIATRMEQKYQHKLDKGIEEYRSQLEQCRYVTKSQFDREFEIYRSISKTFFHLQVKLSSFMEDYTNSKPQNIAFPIQKKEEFTGLIDAASNAQTALYENAPFIPENIFGMYESIYEKANDQFWIYEQRLFHNITALESIDDLITDEDRKRYKEIGEQLRLASSTLRKYLNTLTIIK